MASFASGGGISALLALLLVGCFATDAPRGLRATPPGDGPVVVWDVSAPGLPRLPLPNDALTWPDPTSPTGRRLDVGFRAGTALEDDLASDLNELCGFSITGPIRVPFDADIDVDNLRARQGRIETFGAFEDDAIYLVNLETGLPEPLGFGADLFPLATAFEGGLLPNNPRAGELTIAVDTSEGGDDDPVAAYDRASLAYNRATRALEVRPVRPLLPAREYAVVLTNRLQGLDHRPVRSPLDDVHPAAQAEPIAGLARAFAARPDLYGNLADRGLDGVAFTWTFTTDATTYVAEALRDGLRGEGPYATLASALPARAVPLPVRGGVPGRPCPDPGAARYRVSGPELGAALARVAPSLFGWDAERAAALAASFDSISYAVAFAVELPTFMGNPDRPSALARMGAVAGSSSAPMRPETVIALAFVPRDAGEAPLRPLVVGHDLGGSKLDLLPVVGLLAEHAIAPVLFDAPGHGAALDEAARADVLNELGERCPRARRGRAPREPRTRRRRRRRR